MEGKGNISDYRSKLDKTLASPDLTNDETIYNLVKNQLQQSLQREGCTENVVERRSREVSNFLIMLRSASATNVERSRLSEEPHGCWKVKQDTEEFRVMYREGPEGTPFHTLLAEGYVDGPIDVCLCISWESTLYNKWWPQTGIPTFKIISNRCLQKVRTGEQISLVRMKVSWPLSSREALIHYFVFEYFQEDLIVVLLNSISDPEVVDKSTHGFTRDLIPDAEDVVRIDVVGGFALQKVTADRSYFRTIANMDIKLDFVPPAFINFVSRQLIGSGFKLYKKEVTSVTKGDQRFSEALKGPLYNRIRLALYSENIFTGSPNQANLKSSTSVILEEQNKETFEDNENKESNVSDDAAVGSEVVDAMVREEKPLNEIEECEEKDTQESASSDNDTVASSNYLNNQITRKLSAEAVTIRTEGEQHLRTTDDVPEKNVAISPRVRQALGTLEKAISVLRECNSIPDKGSSDITQSKFRNFEKDGVRESVSSEADDQISRKHGSYIAESSKIGSHEPRNSSDSHASRPRGSNSYAREMSQSRIAPASPDDEGRASPSTMDQKAGSMGITEIYSLSSDANNIDANGVTEKKKKRSRLCCFHFSSGY